jgi:hypothetical protein
MYPIYLIGGKVTLVSEVDFLRLKRSSWRAMRMRGRWYAARYDYRSGKRRLVLMHRQIMQDDLQDQPGAIVVHVNGDSLDNCRPNLKVVSRTPRGSGQQAGAARA